MNAWPIIFLCFSVCACQGPALDNVDGGGEDGDKEEPAGHDGNLLPEESAQGEEAGARCAEEIPFRDLGQLGLGESESVLPICTGDNWWLVLCSGSIWRIRLQARGAHVVYAAVEYPDVVVGHQPIDYLTASPQVEGEIVFTPPRSGEFRLEVRSLDPERESAYRLSLECQEGCSRECTRFPLVLVHGWTGFESIGPVDYFYGVPDDLRGLGYELFIPVLDPYNSTEVRSEQLAVQIEDILAKGRTRRVNLIAHSQGGLDARRAISTLGFGDRVSTLTTFATPHHGTPIADIALGLLPGPAQEALAFLINLIGAAGGHESDALASFGSLTTEYVEETFNPDNPDDPRVAYYSWTGICCPLGLGCGDTCDVEIGWSHDIIYVHAGDNDGMVPISSAPWGDFGGVVPADHFDEVGQLLGVTGPNFDHLEFYRQVVRKLVSAGY